MNRMRKFLPCVALLLSGCASAPTSGRTPGYAAEQTQIRRRLDEIIDAAEKKDFPRLDSYHRYGPKFTKFATESPARLDAEAARKGEHDGLGAATDLVMHAEDVKINVYGDVGIATLVLDYSFKAGADTIQKKALTTLVFVRDGSEWRITHEHLSAVKPAP
jgi:ketosteroid isomerase-like protein